MLDNFKTLKSNKPKQIHEPYHIYHPNKYLRECNWWAGEKVYSWSNSLITQYDVCGND